MFPKSAPPLGWNLFAIFTRHLFDVEYTFVETCFVIFFLLVYKKMKVGFFYLFTCCNIRIVTSQSQNFVSMCSIEEVQSMCRIFLCRCSYPEKRQKISKCQRQISFSTINSIRLIKFVAKGIFCLASLSFGRVILCTSKKKIGVGNTTFELGISFLV